MHRPPLFVHSHLGVNFSVLYFRRYGPLPHYTEHSHAGIPCAARRGGRATETVRAAGPARARRPGRPRGRPGPAPGAAPAPAPAPAPAAAPPGAVDADTSRLFFIKLLLNFWRNFFLQICNELRHKWLTPNSFSATDRVFALYAGWYIDFFF